MVDFVRNGVVLTPSDTELRWPGGRGSFIANGTFTSVTLQAEFDPTAGAQGIDAELTLAATGVVNFELPNNCILSVVIVGGPPGYLAAKRITEKGAT